ncbi:hypothetical protein C5F47_03575 [Nitrosopumilus cobalaminigenes]|uniref:Uncharacterized protein n=1 Tax=Nitrosopumilus cobalaminigenes TaxID=1470066 RepID=A0A7D5R272_9ARCH|nr:hypothetical protein [Nitrosopumilus cobalaminigenes]QLH02699.1 hypothetical protein C5F47_03575 [Nitrosopumilus cobalaminigenes]
MANIGAGEIIYDLRKKIQEIQVSLKELGDPVGDMPEMIETANLLRSNDYLSKANEKKTELLDAYEQYSSALEELLLSVFDIQKDLKEILKDQSSLISESPKKRLKPKTKSKKK